jgi:hypothetical protein
MHFLLLVIFRVDITWGRERGKRIIVPKSKMFSVEPGAVLSPKGVDAMAETMLSQMVEEMAKEHSEFLILSHSLTKVL